MAVAGDGKALKRVTIAGQLIRKERWPDPRTPAGSSHVRVALEENVVLRFLDDGPYYGTEVSVPLSEFGTLNSSHRILHELP